MHPVLIKLGAILIPSYGVLAAIGVLAALLFAQHTARVARISAQHVWNVCVLALCAGLIAARLLLIAMNWRDLLQHPLWALGLSMIHNPLVAGAGATAGLVTAAVYVRRRRMPLAATLDALAAPVVLGAGCEQVGALLAGSGFGTEASVPWAVTYTSTLAARWSGTPLGVALHPVQAYAAAGFFTLALLLLLYQPVRQRAGDVAGAALMGSGVVVFLTELWRDAEGRGSLLDGALNGPQVMAIGMVLSGAVWLRQRKDVEAGGFPPMPERMSGTMSQQESEANRA